MYVFICIINISIMFSSVSDKQKKISMKRIKKIHKKYCEIFQKPITTQTNTQGNDWNVLDKNASKFKNKPHMYGNEQWPH